MRAPAGPPRFRSPRRTPSGVQSDGSFMAVLDTASLPVSASTYPIDLSCGGDTQFTPVTTTDTLTVAQTPPTLQVVDQGGTYNGNPFPASAQVAGVGGSYGLSLEGAIPSLTDYPGAFSSPGDINVPEMAGVPVAPGTFTAEATFPGSAVYATYSATTYFVISPAKPSVIANDASGPYTGQPFIAGAALGTIDGATVPSLQGVSPTLTYYPGTFADVADLGAVKTLSGAPTDPGSPMPRGPSCIAYSLALAGATRERKMGKGSSGSGFAAHSGAPPWRWRSAPKRRSTCDFPRP